MDIKLLKSFIVLSKSKSYREASEKLFITQPALTKQIKLLEEEINLSLFDRGNHGTKLSREGKMIYDHALILEQQFDHFLCVVRKINTGKTGNLNVGYTSSFLNFVPDIVTTFKHQYPNINIRLTEMSSTEQEDALLKGIIDLGFIRGEGNELLSFIPIGKDNLCVAGYPETLRNSENVNDLMNASTLILLNEHSNPELHRHINDYLKANGINTKSRQYQTNVYSVLALVSARSGITILPQSILSFLKPEISSRPLPGNESVWLLGLAWHRKNENQLRTDFINCVTETLNKHKERDNPHNRLPVLKTDSHYKEE